MLTQTRVGVQKDDTLRFEVLTDLVVDDLGLVLGCDTGYQPLLLGLRDTQSVVGVPDVLGQIVPGRRLLLRRTHEVLDVVEIDAIEVGPPVRHGLLVESTQRLQADVQHPLGFVLLSRDIADHGLGKPALSACPRDVGVRPAIAVIAQRRNGFVLGQDLTFEGHRDSFYSFDIRRGLGTGTGLLGRR